ncbi:hypothetical protein WJX81_008446 [Elliptochloris bilobata]|uniref:SKP1 component dimerisation domain-containing protein n=1 Tax=Elliptochloris bilobata TaxID=381761 RepID=A0AAW1QZT8_9CHLO
MPGVEGHAESVEEVARDVALMSPVVQREVLLHGRGIERTNPIALSKRIPPDVLKTVVVYLQYHQASGRSDKERKLFDERITRVDAKRLCELTSAADTLDLQALSDLTSRALARLIEGKSPEEIRMVFNLPDDLTEEEKLEPVRNADDDPRLRLLNAFYARKRKELQKRNARGEEPAAAPPTALPAREDTRPLDDLLNFIEAGGGGGGGGGKANPPANPKTRSKPGRLAGGAGQAGSSGDDAAAELEAVGAPREEDPHRQDPGPCVDLDWVARQPGPRPITTLTSLHNFRPKPPAARPRADPEDPPDWADPADVAVAERLIRRFLARTGLGAHLALLRLELRLRA